METQLFPIDITKFCRICLNESTQLYSIFSEIIEDEDPSEFPPINEIICSLSCMKVFRKNESG